MFTKRLDITKPKQTVVGPGGIKLYLNADKIVPENPGADTPRMVQLRRGWASLEAASDFSDVGGEEKTDAQNDWLQEIAAAADQWHDHWWKVAEQRSVK
jgi:hypothetical protein